MTAQPVEANVVLTADNSQYDQAMTQSAGTTNTLGQSVDNLGMKISKLTKVAGKSLIGISAADVALITGATAAWSSYEKQMSLLQAQSAVLTRTQAQQATVMKDYTGAVKGLRTAYGTTTAEAASLVQTLSKITTIRQSRDLTDLSKVFVDMSHATGESSDGLASSLTNLQKVMGTRIDSKHTRQYADQFTYLAAQTQGSAQQLIDFTAQLAPAGRQIGIHSDQMAGFATAFMKAGADAGPAANVFTKITTDIAHSLQTGSPEIAHYANLIGVTQKAFKDMSGGDQVLAIFQALQSNTKGAATELSRLGLDGPRSIRAIQSVLQGGSLQQFMADAQTGKGAPSRGAAKDGADAADTMSRSMDKLTEQTKMFAETMGSYFQPAVEGFIKGLTKAMHIVNDIAEGPLGKLLGTIMQIVAPFATGAGAVLLFAGALLKVAGAFTLLRSSAAYGVREGMAGGGTMTRMPDGSYAARGRTMLGERGAQLAEGGTWLQRAQYQVGQPIGGAIRSRFGIPMMVDAYRGTREAIDPKYVRPEGAAGDRSTMSYLAGGLGRGIQQFVTPTFDQMRFADPTKRMQWLSQTAPWSKVADRIRLSGHMGAEGLAETQMGAIKTEQAKVAEEPLMTNQARAARLAELKTMEEETKVRADTAKQQRMATEDVINSYKAQTEEVKSSTVGYSRLREALGLTREGVTTRTGLAFGVGGGVMGAGRAAGGALLRSPMGMPIAGMAGMGIMSAAGVQSNMMMGMAGGAMMGPWGALAGGVAGGISDMITANDSATESVKALSEGAAEASKTGLGLGQLDEDAVKTTANLDKMQESYKGALTTPLKVVTDTGSFLGASKNVFEGVFGSSDIEELQRDQTTAQDSLSKTEGAVRDLAKATGTKFTGTRANQLDQMEAFMAGPGGQRLAEAGIDFKDVVSTRKADVAGEQGAAAKYDAMLAKIATGMAGTQAITDKLRGTAAGAAMLDDPRAKKSIQHQEDIGAFYDSIHNMFNRLKADGLSNLQILHSTAKAQHQIGYENSRQFELMAGVGQLASQATAANLPFMSTQQRFQVGLGQLGAIGSVSTKGMTQTELNARQEQEAAATQLVQGQVGAIQQALVMQHQFEISRDRAEQDYQLQRSYAEHDYHLQRERAEESFDRSRRRSQAEYDRSVRRANFEFNLQRTQQENDYHHQVEVQAKQMAQSVYDVYARIQVERTSSAQWILANAQQQIVTMQQQEKNLDILRKRGFTDNAIQQFRLTDPNQAQELARLTTEVTTKAQVRAFNQAAQERLKAGKGLMTDPSSLEFGEMERAQRIGLRRSMDNFQRAQRQGHNDFERGLHQQRVDFNIMMGQQAEDYATMMNRQEHQYHQTMTRAAEDLANFGEEVSGSIHSILTRGTKELTGNMQRQAQAALTTFTNLKKSTSPIAISIMKELSSIFGFEYKAPKGIDNTPTFKEHSQAEGPQPGQAAGGVVPGWSPGKDDRMVPLSGGEAIMRPEWARAVGKETIDQMNHKARHGGFAGGGIYRPIHEPVSRGLHDTWTGYSAVDLAAPVGTPVYAVNSGRISRSYDIAGPLASDTYHDAKYGPYGSYGRVMYLKTDLGPEVVYGHLSGRGYRAGSHVRGGDPIGASGSSGNSSGPHLHFGSSDGDPMEFILGAMMAHGHLAGFTGAQTPGGLSTRAMVNAVLKDRYHQAEKAAWEMQGVHPLNRGDISKVINRMGHQAIDKMLRQSGVPGGAVAPAPVNVAGNVALGKRMAAGMGWTGDNWDALYQLWQHESGWSTTADNPSSSAYGIPQALPGSKMSAAGPDWRTNPATQIKWGMNYIKNRPDYGSPSMAWAKWQGRNPHWYGDGSVFTSPNTIGVGERGPEAVIPLNDRGGEFLTKAMMGTDARRIGLHSVPAGGGLSVYNTRIDKSTNFSGPITVQANDPAELIHKLQARQRVMALSRPSLTGSAA